MLSKWRELLSRCWQNENRSRSGQRVSRPKRFGLPWNLKRKTGIMSGGETTEDGAWPVQVTRTAADGLDQCQMESDAVDAAGAELDRLLKTLRDRIERLYMCRRSMALSEAADSGDHADALVLQTTLVELEAYGGRLPDLISGLKTDGGSLTESI